MDNNNNISRGGNEDAQIWKHSNDDLILFLHFINITLVKIMQNFFSYKLIQINKWHNLQLNLYYYSFIRFNFILKI